MARTAYCFDLDGTVSRQELLPLIAEEVGLADEIGVLTEATIKGVIPFEKSFRLRCRLLAEAPVSVVNRAVAGADLDEDVVRFITANADDCFIVSGNLDVWIRPLLERIPCRFITSTADVHDDRLGAVTSVLDKSDAIHRIRNDYGFDHVVAVGDGMNDVPMFESSDVRIAHGAVHNPNDALRQLSDYWTVGGGGLCRLLSSL